VKQEIPRAPGLYLTIRFLILTDLRDLMKHSYEIIFISGQIPALDSFPEVWLSI